jgi:hypothetical protein
MRKVTYRAAVIGFLTLSFPAFAIYQEPNVPQTDRSEQIPGNSIKLDQNSDKPSTEKKKPQKDVKPRDTERAAPRQATRKPPKGDQPEQGTSPEMQRAVGTMLDIGIGVGLGMGRHGGDDRGMRDR